MGWNPIDDAFDFVGDVAEKAVKTTVDVATGGAYSSYKANKKAKKAQKRHLEESRRVLERQKSEALDRRKQLVDQQREQISRGNYSTRHTSEKGITGKIKRDELG